MQSIEQANRVRRRGAQSGPGGHRRMRYDLERYFDVRELERFTCDCIIDLVNACGFIDSATVQLITVLGSGWQPLHHYIDVMDHSGRHHSSAVLTVEIRKIRTATNKADAKRSSRTDHCFWSHVVSLICLHKEESFTLSCIHQAEGECV